MEGLLTLEIKAMLEDIVGQCFYNNRMFDRIVSILSVPMVMPSTSNIVHQRMAHAYPQLADIISDYMADRDCTTIYRETPIGDQDYETPLECFNMMLQCNLDLEKKVINAIKKSESTGDYTTKVNLDSFLIIVYILTKDIMTLIDKAEMYGDAKISWMKFDHDVEDFGLKEEYI